MIAIPEQLEQQIIYFAEIQHESPDKLLVKMLEDALENYHDLQAVQEAKTEIERGEDEFVSISEAMRLLDEMVCDN